MNKNDTIIIHSKFNKKETQITEAVVVQQNQQYYNELSW